MAILGKEVMGWVTVVGNVLKRDARGRILITLTESALSSLKEGVITVGHELHHIRDILAGAGPSEELAEAFGLRFWEIFKKGLNK